MLPATHFAPRPRKLSNSSLLSSTTLVTVTALAGVPDFVRKEFGEKVLEHAKHAAMLDIEAIEDQDSFIPHLVVTRFVDTVAKLAGQEHFGLILAPHLTMASKGCWAAYVLGAPTLGEAIERGIATIGFHSKGDALSVGVTDGQARLSYASAAKGHVGYQHVANGTAGILIDFCRAFLTPHWRPLRIELDLPRPRDATVFEDIFECPVVFDARGVSICFEASLLGTGPSRDDEHSLITVGDIARARVDWCRVDRLSGVIEQQIWSQMLSGQVSIENAARSIDTSVRTLQRELNREGTTFRDLANALRAKRAMELLRDTSASVTQISTTLGYSAPAHFARAFRNATGIGPQEFRGHRQQRPVS